VSGQVDQHASASGDSVIVQFVGDENRVAVTIGGRVFAHRQLHKDKEEPANLNELLRADIRATSLVGRQDELGMLAAWLAAPPRVAVKCLIGGAGAGKTRLAIEACEAAEAAGWFATFAPSSELQAFHAVQNLVSWEHEQPMLVVVDYAATSATVLKSWFDELARTRRRPGAKLRVLLLERHADSDNGWWAELRRRDSNDHATAADLTGGEVPHALAPLDAERDRRVLLAEAMRKAAPLFDPPHAPVAPPAPGADAGFDRRLAGPDVADPLFLVMAGIRAVECGAPTALAMNKLDLARDLAAIERARLRKFALARGFADRGRLFEHLIACVTLQNGCDPEELVSLVREEQRAMEMAAPFDDESIAHALCDFLTVQGKVETVRPDLIGESFCLPIIHGDQLRNDEKRVAIVLRCWRRDSAGTIETLIRCARDLADGNAAHASVRYLRAVMEATSDLAELRAVAAGLPFQTLALRELAADVEGRIAETVRANADDQASLADALNNLAYRLIELGRLKDALATAEEATALYRQLAAMRPDTFTPYLAGSLNTLTNPLSNLRRFEEALAAAEEATTLYRKLAAERPDAFTVDLAGSLCNLGSCLSNLGRREDALAAGEEAVTLYRQLASSRPDAFAPHLAMSINNLANRLTSLGRHEDAFAAAEEATTLYRTLAAALPDAFTHDLAMALNNLAYRLSSLGRHKDALAAADEAATRYRTLATIRPDVFIPDLAGSLNNLAIRLSEVGRHQDALAAAKEAATLHRQLATAQPDAFTPDLTTSLSILANRLSNLGRHEEALAAAVEGLAFDRQLAAARPDTFTPGLAMSLNNLASYLSNLGRHEEALAAAEEAVALRGKLAAARPDAFTLDLATSLAVLGNALEANDRMADAVARSHEAVARLAPYCITAPHAFFGPMTAFLPGYLRRAKAAGIAADAPLVASVWRAFVHAGLVNVGDGRLHQDSST